MKPVRTPEMNVTLTHPRPDGTPDPERDVPAQRILAFNRDIGETEQDARHAFISLWMPDEQEAARLEAGAAVELMLYGQHHPPVSIAVTDAVLPAAEWIRRDHVDRALGHLYAQIADRTREAILQMQREHITPDLLNGPGGTANPEAVGLPDPSTFADLWTQAVDATHMDANREAAEHQAAEIRSLPETDHPKED